MAPSAPTDVEAAPVLVTTLAGMQSFGSANGPGSAATFNYPTGVAVDASGNVYVADDYNNLIREVTPDGTVSTIAGTGSAGALNGMAGIATFDRPEGVAVDSAGDVYIVEWLNCMIRKITATGVVTTVAGGGIGPGGSANGPGSVATFDFPQGVAVDAAGDVYVADTGNNLIRKVSPTGLVSTLAGTGSSGSADGPGSAASFLFPVGVAVDAAGNVYVADSTLIRQVTPAGEVTTLAGGSAGYVDGPGSAARFRGATGLAVDALGNIYVADSGNFRIREVTPSGVVTTLAGAGPPEGSADGPGSIATFHSPVGVAVGAAGNVYVADMLNNLIREITSVGSGQLAVAWSPPSQDVTPMITSYTATASASGQATQSCTASAYLCTLSGLTSGVAYTVSVTATNAVGESAPSASITATPN